MRTLLLVLVLAACGGSGGDTTTTPAPDNEVPPTTAAGPTCADAAANAVTELTAAEAEITAEQKSQLDALFTQACTDDAWSPEAIRCVAESKAEELERCESLIPAATHDRVREGIEAILDAGHGRDAEPPPP